MNRVVYVAHSHLDLPLAQRVASELELRGYGCRIAAERPKNEGGPLHAIARDLGQARAAIVLLTSAAGNSSQVLREVEWLVVHDRPVLVLRPEECVPSGTLSELLAKAPDLLLPSKPKPEFWRKLTTEIEALGIQPEPVRHSPLQALLKSDRIRSARCGGLAFAAALVLIGLGVWVLAGGTFRAKTDLSAGVSALPRNSPSGLSLVVNQESLVKVNPWPAALPREITNSIGMKFVLIPSGSFTRYSPSNPRECANITLATPYYLGNTEVNQEQFTELMGEPASYFLGELLPVDRATWAQAAEFCRRLSDLPEEQAAGRVYRLPTEAEWEFASRSGSGMSHFFGGDPKDAERFSWFSANAKSETHAVGIKLPNLWGLYDMYGNAEEWCRDWAAEYPPEGQIDPQGPETGTRKIKRGGAIWHTFSLCSSTQRNWGIPEQGAGFRVVCEQK